VKNSNFDLPKYSLVLAFNGQVQGKWFMCLCSAVIDLPLVQHSLQKAAIWPPWCKQLEMVMQTTCDTPLVAYQCTIIFVLPLPCQQLPPLPANFCVKQAKMLSITEMSHSIFACLTLAFL